MSEIKRYFIFANNGYEVEEDVDGQYVEYEDVEPALKLFDLLKDKVKFEGENCSSDCDFVWILPDETYCAFSNKHLKSNKRCQQCLDIFGGVE